MHSFILQVLITQYEEQIQQLQGELKEIRETKVENNLEIYVKLVKGYILL